MTTAQHTPGPWELVENSWAITTIYAPDRQGAVCELNMGDIDEDLFKEIEATQRANARLIAAAPELLEDAYENDNFLMELYNAIPVHPEHAEIARMVLQNIQERRKGIRAAIAKAKGGAV